MLTINPVRCVRRRTVLSFEQHPTESKTLSQIRNEGYTKDIETGRYTTFKWAVYWVTDSSPDAFMDRGIPNLLAHAKKGDKEKKAVISILIDLAYCDRIRKSPSRANYFFGDRGRKEITGILPALEELKAKKLIPKEDWEEMERIARN